MPKICCPIKIQCPSQPFPSSLGGELEFDFPLANYSSELPDPLLFLGNNWGWNLNAPRIGTIFNDPVLPGFCASAISQDDADVCGHRAQLNNTLTGGSGGTPWESPNGQPITSVPNDQQACAWTCPDGLLFIWTVLAGAVVSFNKATANQIASTLACNQARLRHVCLPNVLAGCVGEGYQQTITPSGTAPFTFAIVAGSLPPGLAFLQPSPQAALIAGTPLQAGTFNFTLQVIDALGNFMTKQYSVAVLDITNKTSLPHFSVNSPYTAQLAGVGGVAPYTFTLIGGTLPTGLTLSASGLISGTPTSNVEADFTVLMADSIGNDCTEPVVLKPSTCADMFTALSWFNFGSATGDGTFSGSVVKNLVSVGGTTSGNVNSTSAPSMVGTQAAPISAGITCNVTIQNVIASGPMAGVSWSVIITDQNTPAVYLNLTGTGAPPPQTAVVIFPAGAQINASAGIVIGLNASPRSLSFQTVFGS